MFAKQEVEKQDKSPEVERIEFKIGEKLPNNKHDLCKYPLMLICLKAAGLVLKLVQFKKNELKVIKIEIQSGWKTIA